jgi:hypothetical protein
MSGHQNTEMIVLPIWEKSCDESKLTDGNFHTKKMAWGCISEGRVTLSRFLWSHLGILLTRQPLSHFL